MDYIPFPKAYDLTIQSRKRSIQMLAKFEDEENRAAFIALDDKILATYYLYIEKNIVKAKNCYYEAALAKKFMQVKFNYWIGGTFSTLFYPILLDNRQLIDELQNIVYDKQCERVGTPTYFLCKGFQAVLRNDEAELDKFVNLAYKRSKSSLGKLYAGVVLFYEGILENSTIKIFDGVNLLQKKIQREQQLVIGNYMNFEATGLAKLAWLKGHELDFKNKYIPQELLPIKELEHYESFDFFKVH